MKLKTCTNCGRAYEPRVRYHGLCPECEPHGRDQRSPTTRAQDSEYAAERARVLAGGPPCVYCGEPAITVDHVVAVARGGRHRGNLVPACGPCNASKQDGAAPQARGALAERIGKDGAGAQAASARPSPAQRPAGALRLT